MMRPQRALALLSPSSRPDCARGSAMQPDLCYALSDVAVLFQISASRVAASDLKITESTRAAALLSLSDSLPTSTFPPARRGSLPRDAKQQVLLLQKSLLVQKKKLLK